MEMRAPFFLVVLSTAIGACAPAKVEGLVDRAETRSSAIVCPAGGTNADCEYFGAAGLQAAVDDTADGGSIHVRAGAYIVESWRDTPFRVAASEGENVFQLRAAILIEGKQLSIVGEPGVLLDNLGGPPVSAVVVRDGQLNLQKMTIRNFAYGEDEDEIYDGHGVFALDADLLLRDVVLEAVDKMAVSGRGDSHIDMERVWIRDGHVGLWLRETSTARVSDVVMNRLEVAGVANYAQTVASITNSVFVDIVDDAVYGSEDASVVVRDSVFERNRPYAVHADGRANIVLSSSQFSGNAGDHRAAPDARLTILGELLRESSEVDDWFAAPAGSRLVGGGSAAPWRKGAERADIGVSGRWSEFFKENEAALTNVSTSFRDCTSCPMMQPISSGSFEMGHPVDRDYGQAMNGPRHVVNIEQPFAIGVHEVTRGEFASFVEATGYQSGGACNLYTETTSWHIDPELSWREPGYQQADDHPVVCITWADAVAYTEWLSEQTGESYRLPSEAEWEFLSARNGMGAGFDGNAITHEVANIGAPECCGPRTEGADRWMHTAPVGSFSPDLLGLYDLHGNVFEWQADCHNDDFVGAPVNGAPRLDGCNNPGWRVVRGGSWGDTGEFLATTFRLRGAENEAYFTLGFRVARDL